MLVVSVLLPKLEEVLVPQLVVVLVLVPMAEVELVLPQEEEQIVVLQLVLALRSQPAKNVSKNYAAGIVSNSRTAIASAVNSYEKLGMRLPSRMSKGQRELELTLIERSTRLVSLLSH
jgi:hypothetical protein